MCAVEARRGCGWRKIGGTYLITDPGAFPCERIPFELAPCPLCEHRPSFTRGLQHIIPKMVTHSAPPCRNPETCAWCPFGKLIEADTAGLLWIGDRYYSPAAFQHEATVMGVSRRVSWPLPKWFKVGTTWLLCVHNEAIEKRCEECQGLGKSNVPTAPPGELEDCEACEGVGAIHVPGVFFAFVPQRVERIVPDTMGEDERGRVEEQGLSLVTVPHDDVDHQASKRREEE